MNHKRPNAKSLANLRPIKKGEVRNPRGAGAHKPKASVLIQNLTVEDLTIVGKLILKRNVRALNKIIKNPKATVLKVMTASIAVKAIQKGDHAAWNALLDRFIGKVPVMQNVNLAGNNDVQVILTMPSNGREAVKEGDKKEG